MNFKHTKTKMKKIWLFILSLFTTILAWNLTQANENYEFTNLDITADILIDGTVNIKEDYTANFFVERHGISREIPLNHSVWWKDFHIEISDINVEWKKFTTSKSDWEWHIKIWDPNMTIIWEQTYPISYSTYGLVRNFSWKGYAELYWDLVWDKWNTSINNCNAEILLPKPYTWFTADDFLINIGWVKTSIENFDWTVDRSQWDRILIKYNGSLPSYTKFSLSVKFPNNYFEFDHNRQAWLIWSYQDSEDEFSFLFIPLILLIPTVIYAIIAGLIISIFLLIKFLVKKIFKKSSKWDILDNKPRTGTVMTIRNWRRRTKIYMWLNWNEWRLKWDFSHKFPVIVRYEPPKWLENSESSLFSDSSHAFGNWMNSAEVWLLLHRKAKAKDLFSLLYKRAYEKFVEIKPGLDNSITITKVKELPDSYPLYEKKFFNNLIPHSEKTIFKDDNLYNTLDLEDLEDYWISKWWFLKKDNKYQKKFESIVWWIGWFLLLCYILFFILAFIFASKICIYICFISFPIAWVLLFFWWIINKIRESKTNWIKETEKWAEFIAHILWYREFLAKCDENKLRLFLKQDPLYFDKILPYAIVFGLDTILIDKVSSIMKDLNIKSNIFVWDFNYLNDIRDTFSSVSFNDPVHSSYSSYSSDSWFDSWSSFDSDFGSDSWGGWGGCSDW